MDDKSLEKILSFITYVEAVKKLERYKGQYYWKDYPKLKRYESVADHSWRTAIIIMIIRKYIKEKFYTEKAIKMALIHDIPEIMAGDQSPLGKDGTGKSSHAFDENKKVQKRKAEEKAAKKVFKKLPKKIGDEMFLLWKEYENGKSLEAKVVKAVDKIEAMLQVYEYRKGHMFKKHLDFTIKYGLEGSRVDKTIESLRELITQKLKEGYQEYKKDEK